jgi:hypothetical protein
MNGRSGRKWFQEALDGNDLKPRKYHIKWLVPLSRLVGKLDVLSCCVWPKCIFRMLIYLYGSFFVVVAKSRVSTSSVINTAM